MKKLIGSSWDFEIAFLKGVAFHLFALFSIYHLLFYIGAVGEFPFTDTVQLIKWDAMWYEKLKTRGYFFSYTEQSNIAFFPLFPYLWSFLGLKNGEMCLLNFFIYVSGMYLLGKTFKQEIKGILLMMALPSAFFFYQLYSESLFFLSCSILLVGYAKKDWRWQLLGFILASLTRSAGTMFPPAIIVTEVFLCVFGYQHWRSMLLNILWKLTVCVGIFYGVLLYQAKVTGVWGGFFYAQAKFWDRTFHIPDFPFWVWQRANNFWMDGLALTICFLAVASLAWRSYQFLKKEESPKGWVSEESALVFSEAYLVAILGISLFFSTIKAGEGTFLMSINRFVLATPFSIVFLWLHWRRLTYSKMESLFIGSLLVGVFILFGVYKKKYFTLPTLFFHGLSGLYFLTFYLYRKYKPDIFLAFYLINIALQIVALMFFLQNKWIG